MAGESKMQDTLEVSIVMPCLNEEKTIGICVEKALAALREEGGEGEVIVCDNGSTDQSAEIARSRGARVVYQPERGYGNAYLKGISEAKGRYILIADSDNTYDFMALSDFIAPLRNGYDLVIGSRIKGEVLPGAMPWLHRYVGVPILTGLLNLLFGTRISDAHCGMRSFTREALERMNLRTTGMEFASEMVIKASRAGLKITEVPITYYPREGESKLRSFPDGWRHLRFMLLYSPTYLFLVPGGALSFIGFMLLFLISFGRVYIGNFGLDIHSMVLGSLLFVLGFEIITLGIYAKVYAKSAGLEEGDRFINFLSRHCNLERGVLLGLLVLFSGLAFNIHIASQWISHDFNLDGRLQLRAALWGLTLMLIGAQVMFSSFFLSILGIKKR